MKEVSHLETKKTYSYLKDFENFLFKKNLKENTINSHLENLKIFEEDLHCIDSVVKKLKVSITSLNKTQFNKTITSLNKYYSYSLSEPKSLKEAKMKLKFTQQAMAVKF